MWLQPMECPAVSITGAYQPVINVPLNYRTLRQCSAWLDRQWHTSHVLLFDLHDTKALQLGNEFDHWSRHSPAISIDKIKAFFKMHSLWRLQNKLWSALKLPNFSSWSCRFCSTMWHTLIISVLMVPFIIKERTTHILWMVCHQAG